jgi:hypothetical protein
MEQAVAYLPHCYQMVQATPKRAPAVGWSKQRVAAPLAAHPVLGAPEHVGVAASYLPPEPPESRLPKRPWPAARSVASWLPK